MKKGFILGLTTGVVLTGASLVLANSQIQAILNDQIKVTLNGQAQEFKDETTNEIQYPITYQNRTYLPLRTVANLVGVDVDYDASSNTAILNSDNNFSMVSGKYSVTIDSEKSVELNLYENGIFEYTINYMIPGGVLGNYIVQGDEIKLTYWFNTGSDISLNVTEGSRFLKINSDASITDSIEGTTIKLMKTDELEDYDITNKLATSFFNESNHTVEESHI